MLTMVAERFLSGLKVSVFALRIVPRFSPTFETGAGLFEDGGVIDNVPITFRERWLRLDLICPQRNFEAGPNNTSLSRGCFGSWTFDRVFWSATASNDFTCTTKLAALREMS